MSGLWQHQIEAINFAKNRPATMLAMDMGTGKTRVALELIQIWDAHTVLIICPKTVMAVWPKEIKKYMRSGDYTIMVIDGMIRDRVDKIKNSMIHNSKRMIIINYDVLYRDIIKNALYNIEYDLIILDESHRAKAAGSKTSKVCHMLGRRSKRRLCLTGTPMGNSPLDVYGQYRFLDSTIFGTRYDLFLDKYAVRAGPEHKFIVGYKNIDDLSTKFNRIAYQCNKQDLIHDLNLLQSEPPVELLVGELPSNNRKVYAELSKDFVTKQEFGLVTASTVLVKMLRLQQITSGLLVTDDNETKIINTIKRDILQDLIGDLPVYEPVVVFCRFKHDIQMVRSITGRNVYELSGNINELEKWNNDSNGVIAVQYAAGGVGINLTHSCYAIYLSLTHSLLEYEQSKSRIHRPGQTKMCTLFHIIINNSIDVQMYNALIRKINIIEDIMTRGLVRMDIDCLNDN